MMTPEDYLEDETFEADDDSARIAEAFFDWGGGPDWLDLGAGPMTVLWSLFNPLAERVTIVDRLQGNIDLQRAVQKAPFAYATTRRAAECYRSFLHTPPSPEELEELVATAAAKVGDAHLDDVLAERADWKGAFDFVSQIGCFGCLDNVEQFARAIRLARSYLKSGGRFLSVTWLQSEFDGDVVWNGPISANLGPDSIADLMIDAGFVMRAHRPIPSKVEVYDCVVISVAEARPGRRATTEV